MDGEKRAESVAMQAVTLDSLAGLETSAPIPLGRTAGVNYRASTASGTLALYPEYSVEEKKRKMRQDLLGEIGQGLGGCCVRTRLPYCDSRFPVRGCGSRQGWCDDRAGRRDPRWGGCRAARGRLRRGHDSHRARVHLPAS